MSTELLTQDGTLNEQGRHDFEQAKAVLVEKLRDAEQTRVAPEDQEAWRHRITRMRALLWLINDALENGKTDFALVDRLCV